MSITNSSRFFPTIITDISVIENDFIQHFEGAGYTVSADSIADEAFYSITKGGLFAQVAGQKTGLNIEITKVPGGIKVSMKVGMFSKQIIPTLITLYVAWPAILVQMVGMIKQSKLDEEAYTVIEEALKRYENEQQNGPEYNFCTSCGAKVDNNTIFCPSCGAKVKEEVVCPACGAVVAGNASFCTKCGAKIK